MLEDHNISQMSDDDLSQRRKDRLQKLARLTDEELSVSMMPDEPREHWPAEAKDIFSELRAVLAEQAKRNSMRCSREVSRFKKELDSGQPLSDEVQRWWLDRY